MIATISPLVKGPVQHTQGKDTTVPPWPILWLAHLIACGVGGALMGLIVGGVTILVSAPLLRLMASGLGTPASLEGLRYGVLGVLALLAASHDLSVLKLPLPHFLRQVPRAWVYDLPPLWTSIGFGLQLGALFLTVMPLAAVFVVVLYGGLTGNLLAGVLLGALCGASRALPLLATGGVVGRVWDSDQLSRWVLGTKAPARVIVGVAGGVLAGLCLATGFAFLA